MRVLLGLFLIWFVTNFQPPAIAQDLDVTEIVAASEAFSGAQDLTTRNALFLALTAYDGDATVESVNAYVSLLLFDGAGDDNERLFASASAARTHFEPIADVIPKQYLEARFLAAVALFNMDQDAEAMVEMAHVEGRARAFTDRIGERPDWATYLKWNADAWGMAMGAYFRSADEDHPNPSEIQAILASYGEDLASRNADAARNLDENGLPFCSGRMIQRPSMRYPFGKAAKGFFGAVILQMDLDPDGQVLNPRVVASVPTDVFEEKSLRVVGKWKFRPADRDAVGVTCRLQRTNIIQPLTFQLR